ncbi:MAG TPA: AAA family ATPase, partial [Planctomycetota bacterium]|nr:AAA family ATPase [Planctomycetota bacterium]
MRYLVPHLRKDLREKLVLLSGPRQVGKSTLAKGLLDEEGIYLNWDIRQDKRVIRDAAWPKDASLVVLDELHKLPKWKNFL